MVGVGVWDIASIVGVGVISSVTGLREGIAPPNRLLKASEMRLLERITMIKKIKPKNIRINLVDVIACFAFQRRPIISHKRCFVKPCYSHILGFPKVAFIIRPMETMITPKITIKYCQFMKLKTDLTGARGVTEGIWGSEVVK